LHEQIDTVKLAKSISWAFYNEKDTVSPTHAVVVVYNNQLVYEKYANGITANTKLAGWSMAKSITNAMMGILVKKRKINMSSPAAIAEWQNDERKKITPANLMQLNSGLHWWGFEAAASNQTNMLFKEDDMAGYALKQSLTTEPGKIFNYSDGSVCILQLLMRRMLGDQYYYRFPYEQLFYKIGMRNTVLEPDANGTFNASYVYATARDWARFGLLYLHDGVWNGERILPEGWVRFSTTQSKAINKHKGGRYGAGWWINEPDRNSGRSRLYGKVPADCFYAQGYDGQYVWVIPSKKLVVVRLAREAFTQFIPDDFLADIIRSLPK
jgi:CubicO group peptidase (beta-lactamase class C family)